jgi:hypothetical protein
VVSYNGKLFECDYLCSCKKFRIGADTQQTRAVDALREWAFSGLLIVEIGALGVFRFFCVKVGLGADLNK